ncbi:MAG: hypothetical protein A2X66_09690 [Ignavibacteria bacterium GWA2_54_16]|nr:MAG: hypothetical protein A2X66_09690 [Ignavibacteria bacterium GWA2_54_16]
MISGSANAFSDVGAPSYHTSASAEYCAARPDWVLMDIEMDPVDGITASKEILSMDAKANNIFVSQYDDQEYHEAAEKLGVKGYVLKTDLLRLVPLLKLGGTRKRAFDRQ